MGMVNPSSPSSTFKISKNFQHVEENMKGTTFSDFLAAILPNFEKVSSYPF